MKRKVYIVEGHAPDEEERLHFGNYAKRYFTYFNHTAGGAFQAEEIVHLKQPALSELEQVAESNDADYVVQVFIGHGGENGGSQIFWLDESVFVRPGGISFSARKQLIILETCRVNADYIVPIEFHEKTLSYHKGGVIRVPISKTRARARFIEELESSDDGQVICAACDSGEKANNLYFSRKLMHHAFNWYNDPRRAGKVLSILELFPTVASAVTEVAMNEEGAKQSPQIYGESHFPFVVNKY